MKFRLIIEEAKLFDYLLNLNHPDGGPKARFFHNIGFSLGNWQELSEALKAHYQKNNESGVEVQTSFGV